MSTETLPTRQPDVDRPSASISLEPLPGDLSFDLDIVIDTKAQSNSAAITSRFFCTPGCTSPGGGSFCSYCC